MSHLEDLLCEYYEWQGYIVRRNVKVGRLAHGGWEGELDIVAYHPKTRDLVHLEPSIDSLPWSERQGRFARKFKVGTKYIREVLPWLDSRAALRQMAVLVSRGNGRDQIGGGEVRTIDEFVKEIRGRVLEQGKMAKAAIPEQFTLLRTIQLVESGYYKRLD